MSEPFLAEIKMVGFGFAPRGWAFCDGQILSISQNQALFSLLGTSFGGDGRTTFALPDLRGRAPIHVDATDPLGSKGGAENHVLTTQEMPSHGHAVAARTANAQSTIPSGQLLAHTEEETYAPPANLVSMADGSVAFAGGNQGHNNMQPYLAVNFCIALQGVYPPRT